VAASPYASCRDHDHTRHVEDDHGAADHACAMHHHMGHVGAHTTHDAPPVRENGPTLRCQCRASDAALVVLIIGSGMVPARFVLPFQPVTASLLVDETDTLARIELPETPPPRL
jgi:hypothetical protein